MVSGLGSKWANSDTFVGYSWNGSDYYRGRLTVADGGSVTTGTLYGSFYVLSGNGTISTSGLIFDDDLVFDQAQEMQHQFSFGTGGTLNLTLNGNGNLGAGYMGAGTLKIANGFSAASSFGYLGHSPNSSGAGTITGGDSTWTIKNALYLAYGFGGDGKLTIEAGGHVNDADGYVGYGYHCNGTAKVTGTGSVWNNSNTLNVGHQDASGTLQIEDGGQVISASGYVGFYSRYNNAVSITGTGSKWTSRNLIVYRGTLSVSDGGTVSAGTLRASLNDLLGNGVINVQGAVLDGDIVFDNEHGSQPTIAFGSGGRLNLAIDGSGNLGAGFKGAGTLRIADGITAASVSGLIGARGVATVTGAGSTWANSETLIVNGALTIERGGQVKCPTGSLGDNSGDLMNPMVTVSGIGSKWSATSSLQFGVRCNSTLSITAGGQVVDRSATLGTYNGLSQSFVSTAIVDGAGSKWTHTLAYGVFNIGYYADGTLKIEAGGQVSGGNAVLGVNSGINGEVTVTGQGSQWINTDHLIVIGDAGNGVLTIADAGQVSNSFNAYIAYSSTSVGTATVAGAGSVWTSGLGLYVGRNGRATLNVRDGGQVNDDSGYVATSGTGVASVTGAGSVWGNRKSLQISGSGTLNVFGGGAVTASSITLSSSQSLLAVDVGTGSGVTIGGGSGMLQNNDGKIRFLAAIGLGAQSSYKPILADWSGSYLGSIQTVGGIWDGTNHQVIVSDAQMGNSGEPVSIDRLDTQRVLVNDTASPRRLGASFLSAAASAPTTVTATAISGGTLDAIEALMPPSGVLLGGWTLTAQSGYTTGDPVYLSIGDGIGGYGDDNMQVWSFDGAKWSKFTADDLTYDGTYASFTATAMGTYAVTVPVPEPATVVLVATALLGAVAWVIRRRQ
jgi:T5SS/PEP-CTERM-associated repeat protein